MVNRIEKQPDETGKVRIEKGEQYALWLYLMPAVGSKTRCKLLKSIGTEEEVYHLGRKELEALIAGNILTERQAASFQEWKKQQPEALYTAVHKKGITYVSYQNILYPRRLKEIPDPPYGLFVKGGMPEEGRGSVAIIGARECSQYGREMAQWFAKELASAGIQIVSGLARGIDGIGQQSALAVGGRSFGVLGCGADICYPPENKAIYESCIRSGGILSEYAPGVQPKAGFFPARNRIISGLSDVLLVVEARAKSGTLITVDMALEQGREVFVLPGRVSDALSTGCNRLLIQGAAMALSPEDILNYLEEHGSCGTRCRGRGGEREIKRAAIFDAVENREGDTGGVKDAGWQRRHKVWEALDAYPKPFHQIYETLCGRPDMDDLTVKELACLLTELLLDGEAGEKGSRHYYRRNRERRPSAARIE